MTMMLEVDRISVRFGGIQAVNEVSFQVKQGDLLGFIGPNGAGKTTALRIITGLVRPNSGRVRMDGHDITDLPTHRRVQKGLALTHQIVRPFRSMTVLDNVVLAAGLLRTRNPLISLFHVKRGPEEEAAREILERVGLAGDAKLSAATLPLGKLKRLEVARALALKPKVLLLDEPLAGLNQQEANALGDSVVELNQAGLTIILVEHNLGEVLRISKRMIVLDNGRLIAEGLPREVIAEPKVMEAYLGKSETCHVAA